MYSFHRKCCKAKACPKVSLSILKLSFPHVVVFFAVLNAISYYVGYIIRASRNHAINQSSFGTAGLPRSFHCPSGRCFNVANETSPSVEFVCCPEHHLEHCGTLVEYNGTLVHYMIDDFDASGIDRSKSVRKIVSWDKGISDKRNEYYETMVHPALLLHNNPRRIAIMNDITGGILREVLKHSMVKEVIFIIPNARTVLSGCGFFERIACNTFPTNMKSCYDDSRVQIHYYDDLSQWFNSSVAEHIDVAFADATMYVSTFASRCVVLCAKISSMLV